jgi:FtsP/CotA-like multicopper oxidase with cupredoxin domain
MNKKLFANVVALVLLVLGALGSGYAQSEPLAACNNTLIAGDYGFTIQGNKLGGQGPIGPQIGVAMTEFDGRGGLTQIDTVTVNGEVVADFTHTPATGTYRLNSDCTGTFTIIFTDGRPPVVANFVVVESGLEIDTVVVSAGGNQGIIATGSVGKRRFCKH